MMTDDAAGLKVPGQDAQILWADVGQRLGATVTELRSLRGAFGDLLGLGPGKTVSESIVPVLEHIQALRREGVPDEEIRRRIASLSSEAGWPEEVLARMQAAPSVSATVVEAVGWAPDAAEAISSLDRMKSPPGEEPLGIPPEPDAQGPQPITTSSEFLLPVASLSAGGPTHERQSGDAVPLAIPQDTVREMVFDLRREMAMNTHSERELMLHLTQSVRKLAMEVRDLRYAFLLASSRKDRKKGLKTLSRLLSN